MNFSVQESSLVKCEVICPTAGCYQKPKPGTEQLNQAKAQMSIMVVQKGKQIESSGWWKFKPHPTESISLYFREGHL